MLQRVLKKSALIGLVVLVTATLISQFTWAEISLPFVSIGASPFGINVAVSENHWGLHADWAGWPDDLRYFMPPQWKPRSTYYGSIIFVPWWCIFAVWVPLTAILYPRRFMRPMCVIGLAFLIGLVLFAQTGRTFIHSAHDYIRLRPSGIAYSNFGGGERPSEWSIEYGGSIRNWSWKYLWGVAPYIRDETAFFPWWIILCPSAGIFAALWFRTRTLLKTRGFPVQLAQKSAGGSE